MCDQCARPEEKTFLLEIQDIHVKTGAKYEAGIDALTKALGYDSELQQGEVSPFRAVRELQKLSKDRVEGLLLQLFETICGTWIAVSKAKAPSPFLLNGRIFINPKSGKPLSNADWMIIKRDILKAFNFIYSGEDERIALHALSLGKIIKGLPLDKQLMAAYKSLKPAVNAAMATLTGPEWVNTVAFAQQEAGAMIVELTQTQFKAIHDTLQSAIKLRYDHRQLEESLYERFGNMNRDWRRIADTEIGNATNNGQLITELERKTDRDEVIYMKGISSGSACPWCRQEVNGKIVVLLSDPLSGMDSVDIGGVPYTAIWPGKTNFGRKRANWWVSAGTQHPHCVTGGQLVATNELGAVTKAFYEGFVIEICTASRHRVTVTENHPVLTPNGFVAAKFLTQGSDIFVSPNPDGLHKLVNPDNYQRPTLVENLFASVRHSSSRPPSIMEVASEDFYGDGRFFNSDVDIVFTNSFLWDYFKTVFLKDFYEMLLGNTLVFNSGVLLKKFSTSFQFLQGYGCTPPYILRLLSHLITFFLAHPIKSNLMGFFASSEVDSNFVESVMQGIPAHSNLSGEFIQRFSCDVPVNDALREATIANSGSFVVPSRVTGLVRQHFSGHVYDLQDEMYGLYTCNGVIVKNCMCTWVKHIPGFEAWDDKFRAAMDQAREKGKEMKRRKEETVV